MTSTNDGKEVKSIQTSAQKGKSYYIELYKSLEAGLSEGGTASERTKHLCEAWRRVHSLCQHSTPSTHPHLLSWLQRHTARTVLQTEWQSLKRKDDRSSLEEAINVFIVESRSAAATRKGPSPSWETQLVARGEWLKRILHNPWKHPVLNCLLNPDGTPPTDEEVLKWLTEERGVTFVMRLHTLVAEKCDDIASSLATAVMERVRADSEPVSDLEQANEPKDNTEKSSPNFGDRLKEEAGFTVDVWEMLTDIEFVLLHKRDSSKCIALAKLTPLRTAHQLIERLQSRLDISPREKRLWKNSKEVAVLIAQVVIARCMMVPTCTGGVRSALYRCARSLARLVTHARLPPAARALAAPAPTAHHLHMLAAAVDTQLAQQKDVNMKPFVCELYVRAITTGMNELERLKLKAEKDTEARSMEATLAGWFVQLGNVLGSSARVSCECTLTAFSLHPSRHMYDRIQAARHNSTLTEADEQPSTEATNAEFGSWASDSRSQTNFVKTSETLNMKARQKQANVVSTAILNEGEALGLSHELCQDITALLSGPRVKTLSWDMDRELLLENCRAYMERTHGGTKALTTELKFLNLDPSKFLHLPEEDDDENNIYYGIEKGYEHLVEFPEPEDIWQDAGDDEEKTDTASSNEEYSEDTPKLQRKKKTKRNVVNTNVEADPLSLEVDTKQTEKTERPVSKERCKKKLVKDALEVKDAHEVKDAPKKEPPKEKKERKKKEKVPKPSGGPLSKLIGLRVAKKKKTKSLLCVSKSNYDSQEKGLLQSLNSEGNKSRHSSQSSVSVGLMQDHRSSKASEMGITPNMARQGVSSIQTQSPSDHSKNTSPAFVSEVKKSLTKLLEYRQKKSLEAERKTPNAIRRLEVPDKDLISPKAVVIPDIPKSYINKQNDRLTELQHQFNDILAQRYNTAPAIPSPVIQYASRNDTSPSKSNQTPSSPYNNEQRPLTSDRFMNSVNLVSIYDKNEPNSQSRPFYEIPQDIPKSTQGVNHHDFRRVEYHNSFNTLNIGDRKEQKKVIRPVSRVTPVIPHMNKSEKSPHSAKQIQQKKPDGSLNTFSRLSYYKNKQTDMRNKSCELSATPPQSLGSKIEGFILDNLRQSQNRAHNHMSEPQKAVSIHEAPQSKARDHPILANILHANSPQKPVSPPKNTLSEQDQHDLVLLLRQQNLLNKPVMSSSRTVFPVEPHNHTPSNAQSNTNETERKNITEGKMINVLSNTVVVSRPKPKLSNLKKPRENKKTERHKEYTKISAARPDSKESKEWQNVMNALAKHKTPCRGPNALDMALNKSSFEKAFVDSLRTPMKSLFTKGKVSSTESINSSETDYVYQYRGVNITKSAPSPSIDVVLPNAEMKMPNTENKTQTIPKPSPTAPKNINPKKSFQPMIEKLIKQNKLEITKNNAKVIHTHKTHENHDNNVKPSNIRIAKRPQKAVMPKRDSKQTVESPIKMLQGHPKQYTNSVKLDPYTLGIPNSDYDLLEELMDDDLRKEIGELSSDEESYSTAAQDFLKDTKNIEKRVSVVYNDCLNTTTSNEKPVNTSSKTICKNDILQAQRSTQRLNKDPTQTPLRAIRPKSIQNEIPVRCLNEPNIQNDSTQAVTNPPKAYNNANILQNTQITIEPNMYITSVPQPVPLQNVVLIGSELVYEGYTSMQTPIQSVTHIASNTYMTVNSVPNMNLYQTTQFTSPIMSPVILASAVTVPIVANNPCTTAMQSSPMTTVTQTAYSYASSEINYSSPNLAPIRNHTQVNANKGLKDSSITSSFQSDRQKKEDILSDNDANLSRNGERKVLIEVQDKNAAEKIYYKRRNSSDKDIKTQADHERVRKKRLAILNREINQLCGNGMVIALDYSPLHPATKVENKDYENDEKELDKNFIPCIQNTVQELELKSPATPDSCENYKENKNESKVTCRRILLRSSNKLKSASLTSISQKPPLIKKLNEKVFLDTPNKFPTESDLDNTEKNKPKRVSKRIRNKSATKKGTTNDDKKGTAKKLTVINGTTKTNKSSKVSKQSENIASNQDIDTDRFFDIEAGLLGSTIPKILNINVQSSENSSEKDERNEVIESSKAKEEEIESAPVHKLLLSQQDKNVTDNVSTKCAEQLDLSTAANLGVKLSNKCEELESPKTSYINIVSDDASPRIDVYVSDETGKDKMKVRNEVTLSNDKETNSSLIFKPAIEDMKQKSIDTIKTCEDSDNITDNLNIVLAENKSAMDSKVLSKSEYENQKISLAEDESVIDSKVHRKSEDLIQVNEDLVKLSDILIETESVQKIVREDNHDKDLMEIINNIDELGPESITSNTIKTGNVKIINEILNLSTLASVEGGIISRDVDDSAINLLTKKKELPPTRTEELELVTEPIPSKPIKNDKVKITNDVRNLDLPTLAVVEEGKMLYEVNTGTNCTFTNPEVDSSQVNLLAKELQSTGTEGVKMVDGSKVVHEIKQPLLEKPLSDINQINTTDKHYVCKDKMSNTEDNKNNATRSIVEVDDDVEIVGVIRNHLQKKLTNTTELPVNVTERNTIKSKNMHSESVLTTSYIQKLHTDLPQNTSIEQNLIKLKVHDAANLKSSHSAQISESQSGLRKQPTNPKMVSILKSPNTNASLKSSVKTTESQIGLEKQVTNPKMPSNPSTLQSLKNRITIEQLPRKPGDDPLKKTIRIKHINGKVFKGTVRGPINVDAILDDPKIHSLLLTQFEQPKKRYTLKVNVNQVVTKGEIITTYLQPVIKPSAPIETVNLLSDDEEDTITTSIQSFETEYGRYTIQSIDNDLFTKHQNKLKMKSYVPLVKMSHKEENFTKSRSSRSLNQTVEGKPDGINVENPVTQMCSEILNEIKVSPLIPKKYVKELLSDIAHNFTPMNKEPAIEANVVLIDDSSNDSIELCQKSEPKEKIDKLKNMLLKDLGVDKILQPLSESTDDIQVTWSSEAIDLTDDTSVMEPTCNSSFKKKLDNKEYEKIINRKCFVKLVRCDYIEPKSKYFMDQHTQEEIKNSEENYDIVPAPVSRSGSFSLLDDFPIVDDIEMRTEDFEVNISSPVMEVYDIIAALEGTLLTNHKICKQSVVSSNCDAEWMTTKMMTGRLHLNDTLPSKSYNNEELYVNNSVLAKDKSCQTFDTPKPVSIKCYAEWLSSKHLEHILSLKDVSFKQSYEFDPNDSNRVVENDSLAKKSCHTFDVPKLATIVLKYIQNEDFISLLYCKYKLSTRVISSPNSLKRKLDSIPTLPVAKITKLNNEHNEPQKNSSSDNMSLDLAAAALNIPMLDSNDVKFNSAEEKLDIISDDIDPGFLNTIATEVTKSNSNKNKDSMMLITKAEIDCERYKLFDPSIRALSKILEDSATADDNITDELNESTSDSSCEISTENDYVSTNVTKYDQVRYDIDLTNNIVTSELQISALNKILGNCPITDAVINEKPNKMINDKSCGMSTENDMHSADICPAVNADITDEVSETSKSSCGISTESDSISNGITGRAQVQYNKDLVINAVASETQNPLWSNILINCPNTDADIAEKQIEMTNETSCEMSTETDMNSADICPVNAGITDEVIQISESLYEISTKTDSMPSDVNGREQDFVINAVTSEFQSPLLNNLLGNCPISNADVTEKQNETSNKTLCEIPIVDIGCAEICAADASIFDEVNQKTSVSYENSIRTDLISTEYAGCDQGRCNTDLDNNVFATDTQSPALNNIFGNCSSFDADIIEKQNEKLCGMFIDDIGSAEIYAADVEISGEIKQQTSGSPYEISTGIDSISTAVTGHEQIRSNKDLVSNNVASEPQNPLLNNIVGNVNITERLNEMTNGRSCEKSTETNIDYADVCPDADADITDKQLDKAYDIETEAKVISSYDIAEYENVKCGSNFANHFDINQSLNSVVKNVLHDGFMADFDEEKNEATSETSTQADRKTAEIFPVSDAYITEEEREESSEITSSTANLILSNNANCQHHKCVTDFVNQFYTSQSPNPGLTADFTEVKPDTASQTLHKSLSDADLAHADICPKEISKTSYEISTGADFMSTDIAYCGNVKSTKYIADNFDTNVSDKCVIVADKKISDDTDTDESENGNESNHDLKANLDPDSAYRYDQHFPYKYEPESISNEDSDMNVESEVQISANANAKTSVNDMKQVDNNISDGEIMLEKRTITGLSAVKESDLGPCTDFKDLGNSSLIQTIEPVLLKESNKMTIICLDQKLCFEPSEVCIAEQKDTCVEEVIISTDSMNIDHEYATLTNTTPMSEDNDINNISEDTDDSISVATIEGSEFQENCSEIIELSIVNMSSDEIIDDDVMISNYTFEIHDVKDSCDKEDVFNKLTAKHTVNSDVEKIYQHNENTESESIITSTSQKNVVMSSSDYVKFDSKYEKTNIKEIDLNTNNICEDVEQNITLDNVDIKERHYEYEMKILSSISVQADIKTVFETKCSNFGEMASQNTFKNVIGLKRGNNSESCDIQSGKEFESCNVLESYITSQNIDGKCFESSVKEVAEVEIKGVEYEDPEIGTCYVFPIIEEVCELIDENSQTDEVKEVNGFIKKEEAILEIDGLIDESKDLIAISKIQEDEKAEDFSVFSDDSDIELMIPKQTYATNFLVEKCLKNIKRKKDMTDFKFIPKKYRKGKNIDYPKITASAKADTVYAKEYKRIIDYCSTVKFSYSIPFHIECIDVDDMLNAWPIRDVHEFEAKHSDHVEDLLYTDIEDGKTVPAVTDPLNQTLSDEITNGNTVNIYKPIDINETNFNMGFGERSGRVLKKLENGNTKSSAATLSDVKPHQPFSMPEFKYVSQEKDKQNITMHLFMNCINLKKKVQSVLKKTAIELSKDLQPGKKYDFTNDSDLSNFPFGLTNTDFLTVPSTQALVNVVQVGQLPISANAQNPVICDPRVTQVSDVSPSQCSNENSPGEDSQATIETEYTELTTANITLPLQEYVQHHQSPASQEHLISPTTGDVVNDSTMSIVKIELMEETSQERTQENDMYENDFSPLPNNNVEYSFEDTSNTIFNNSNNVENTNMGNVTSDIFHTSPKMDNSFTNIFNATTTESNFTNLNNCSQNTVKVSSNIDNTASVIDKSPNNVFCSTSVYNTNKEISSKNSNITSNLENTTKNLDDVAKLENTFTTIFNHSNGMDKEHTTTDTTGTSINSTINLRNRPNNINIQNSNYDYSYENMENFTNVENNNVNDNYPTIIDSYRTNVQSYESNETNYANVENYAGDSKTFTTDSENYPSNYRNNASTYATNVESFTPNIDDSTSNIDDNITNTENGMSNIVEESHPQDLSLANSSPEPSLRKLSTEKSQDNVTSEKRDQIAHAMNAAGISSETSDTDELTNLINQSSQSETFNTPVNNHYSKIGVLTLQQALAQVLPPPLSQTSSSETNRIPNNPVTQQVLHILQGNNAQTVINKPNGTHLLHIVQNKNIPTANGMSLVDGGLQQGNQLIHIVNNGKQHSAGQFLKRVNLLTNVANAQGSNEQKMIQFVCKSADGKSIQLNTGHQRSMVLRLHPTSVQTAPKPTEPQDLSASSSAANPATPQTPQETSEPDAKSRSVYDENYAQFVQNTSPPSQEKSTSLPKFNQVFGKQPYPDNQNEINPNRLPEHSDGQTEENNRQIEQTAEVGNPPLLVRNPPPPETTQAQPNPVQQIKQTISPFQTMHGGVIYSRQIPVNLGGGQTINLITVPSTELVDDQPKQQADANYGNQEGDQPSIIKLVPHLHAANNTNLTSEENNAVPSNETNQIPQPQPVLTQMRIKLPMLSKGPHIVPGTRLIRPSFFQIQRNVIAGTNQPVYQQLVLTAAPSLTQTIRLPAQQAQSSQQAESPQQTRPLVQVAQPAQQTLHVHQVQPTESQTVQQTQTNRGQTRQSQTGQQVQPNQHTKPDNQPDTELSTLTMEQLREFDMVLEQVKERSIVQPPLFPTCMKPIPYEPKTSADSTDSSTTTSVSESTQQVLYSVENNQPANVVSYVNRKSTITSATTSYVRSPDSSGTMETPSSSTQVQITHTVTSKSTTADQPPTAPPKKKKKKKSSSSSSALAALNNSPSKASTLKPQEDEQTTQRILYILAEYKEQVENSPDKNKPAPRRRNQFPPTTGSKRKRSHCSSRASCRREMSPVQGEPGENGEDSLITLGSEDSSCGTTFSECTECQESHSPEDSPRKVVRRLTFEQETTTQITQTRTIPQRNVIVGDGQTITVARTTTTAKPTTTVLMPANYLLPVSMIKGGQQIAIMTNRGPKLLVGAGDTNAGALLFQRLIGPGLKPVLARPGVRHIRLPTTALHNLQTFNIQTTPVTQVQPPDSTAPQAQTPAPPDLVDTRAMSSPWQEREAQDKPEREPSPDCTEPWSMPSSSIADDYGYEEIVRTDNIERTVLVVQQRKDGRHHRVTHVSTAALRHKYAILEHELRLQKSLSEECEDLGVDSPSASDLFPEADILFGAPSPAHEQTIDECNTPPPIPMTPTPRPDLEDQLANDQLLTPNVSRHEDLDLNLDDVGEIVTVGEDGVATIPTINPEEFARSHPNTTFHTEPEDGEIPPFTIAHGIKGRHITFHANRVPGTVVMAPKTTVISQATICTNDANNTVKFTDIDNMINSMPGPQPANGSALVKDQTPKPLSKFDSLLQDSREPHLSSNTPAIVHSGHGAQVIRRLRYDEHTNKRFSVEPRPSRSISDEVRLRNDRAMVESMGDNASSPGQPELFWDSTTERNERKFQFNDSEKVTKSPFDELLNDSSAYGPHTRLDSVIKAARTERTFERTSFEGISVSGSSDDSRPLRTYPPKRVAHPTQDMEKHFTKTTMHHDVERNVKTSHHHELKKTLPRCQDEGRRRASGRGVVKRGCSCCNGSTTAPPKKRSRPKKPTSDFSSSS